MINVEQTTLIALSWPSPDLDLDFILVALVIDPSQEMFRQEIHRRQLMRQWNG